MNLAFKICATGLIVLCVLVLVMRYEDERGRFPDGVRDLLSVALIAALVAVVGGGLAGIWLS